MWVGTFQIKGALYKIDALTRTAIIIKAGVPEAYKIM
jgi:hypothetical protein